MIIQVLYATREGQTAKIARRIADHITEKGHEVRLADLRGFSREVDWEHVDGVLIGSPVRKQKHVTEAARFVRKHRTELARRRTGFFSVSLAASSAWEDAREAAARLVLDFTEKTRWTPDFAASFSGALKFSAYSRPLRFIMKRISESSGGPTDTARDYEFTKWGDVRGFTDDFLADEPVSRYRTSLVSRHAAKLDAHLPKFDHRLVQNILIERPKQDVWEALHRAGESRMPLARVLTGIRTLGKSVRDKEAKGRSFVEGAREFGVTGLEETAPSSLVGGLIGRFWRLDFGIRRMDDAAQFHGFSEPGYAKTVTAFFLEEAGPGVTDLWAETRVFSSSPEARRKFNRYWLLVSPGIRLYMRSLVHAVKKEAESRPAPRPKPKRRAPRKTAEQPKPLKQARRPGEKARKEGGAAEA